MNFKGRLFFITIIIYGTLMKHITDPINALVGFNLAGIPPMLNLNHHDSQSYPYLPIYCKMCTSV